jgi:hypothetical protein
MTFAQFIGNGSTGIIGSKFLQVDQGHSTAGVIEAGSVIRGAYPVSVEKALTKALASVDKLMEGFNGKGEPGSLGNNLSNTFTEVSNSL